MNTVRGLVIFGFGGHARSVADIALATGVSELRFIDDNALDGERFFNFPVLKQWDGVLPEGWMAFPAAGDNKRRQKQYEHITALGWPIATLVAPSSTIGVGCIIGHGCLIAHHAHVGPMAKVGIGCIVNTSAVIEHECTVGDFAHVSVNSTIAGRSKVGDYSMVGAGATIIDGVEVGSNVTIGAGAVVRLSIGQSGVYVGVPARRIAN